MRCESGRWCPTGPARDPSYAPPTAPPHTSRASRSRASLRSPARCRESGAKALDGAARARFAPLHGPTSAPCGRPPEAIASQTAPPHLSGGSYGTLAGPRVGCENPTGAKRAPPRAPTRSHEALRNRHSRPNHGLRTPVVALRSSSPPPIFKSSTECQPVRCGR